MEHFNMAELNLDSLNEVTGGRSLNSEDRASYLSLMSHFDEVVTRLASSGRRADALAMSGEIEARVQEWMNITGQAPEGTPSVDIMSFCQPVFDKYV